MRISTASTWSNALHNLSTAQERQLKANNQVSTQKIATDLMGYGRSSEIIASYQSALARTNSYIDVNKSVTERLNSQDLALTTVSQAATDAKDSIMNSLANNTGNALMESLQGNFSAALQGLNFEHNGQYLFGGGNDGTAPMTANTLTELAAATTVDDVFVNGTVKKSSRIDPSTNLQTGMLASDLGKQLMQTFKDIKAYNDDPLTGPFGDELTEAQKTFLTTKSQEFGKAYDKLVEQTSLNGTLQKRVDNSQAALQKQSESLQGLVDDRTDADMAKAYTELQQAQVAVQASAQVLANLQSSSLLNLLK